MDSPVSLVWAAYEAAVKDIEEQVNLAALIANFFASADYAKLGIETRKDYVKYSKKVIPVFGKMLPDSVKPQHVRQAAPV